MPENQHLAAARAAGTVDVTMPATGADAPVTIAAWLKRPGERVAEGEVLCVVDFGAGKAEVGSPATGTLRMVTAGAGEQIAVGASLAVVDQG